MAEANGSTAIFCASPQGELARELLDEQGPFLPFPEAADAPPQPARESMMRKLLPTVYSGPTIGDIETALAISNKSAVAEPGSGRGSPLPAVAVPEKGFNRMENKYTLRIKCCANGMADDGYKWRKYGQKSIKNSPNPRSYYRCTNPRCSAKKQVERSVEDPETLVVTYEGLHLHYAYSHFLLPRPRDFSTASNPAPVPPPVKRSKLEEAVAVPLQASTPESPPVAAGPASPTGLITAQGPQRGGEVLEGGGRQEELVREGDGCGGITRVQAGEDFTRRPQGLLEDIVPLLVRKPCSDPSTLSSNPSFSSVLSSPPSSSSSSFTWPHSPTYFDLGVLSGTV